jgi:hypothetical protein
MAGPGPFSAWPSARPVPPRSPPRCQPSQPSRRGSSAVAPGAGGGGAGLGLLVMINRPAAPTVPLRLSCGRGLRGPARCRRWPPCRSQGNWTSRHGERSAARVPASPAPYRHGRSGRGGSPGRARRRLAHPAALAGRRGHPSRSRRICDDRGMPCADLRAPPHDVRGGEPKVVRISPPNWSPFFPFLVKDVHPVAHESAVGRQAIARLGLDRGQSGTAVGIGRLPDARRSTTSSAAVASTA